MFLKCKTAIGLVGLVMVWVLPALGQDTPTDNMRFVVEKIRADKKLFISENMEFTEAEGKAFWSVYEEYQDELFLLRARVAKLINDYKNAYEKMSSETAKVLLDEYMTIESLDLKLRQTYLPRFREVLSDIKVLRYFQIENKINAALVYELAAKIPLIQTVN